jgi:hypothetical protein
MDTARAGHGQRLGLMGMRERALMLGGAFEIESAPGQGTRVMVRIPARPAAGGMTTADTLAGWDAPGAPGAPGALDAAGGVDTTQEAGWSCGS